MQNQYDPEVQAVLSHALVWDNHACLPLRPGDDDFMPQLQRFADSGVDVVSLNIGYGDCSLQQHLRVLAFFRQWIGQHPDRYSLANTIEDIEQAKEQGRLAVIFDIEGMGPLDGGDWGLIELFRQLGVAWMLIAYNHNNQAGGGCMDQDSGLTPHGRRVLAEMKRVGMLVCCSHTGHRTALEVMEAANNPVIFSHSNASVVHPHVRNIPDELIRACAATGGVVGINGIGDFLGEGDDYGELICRHIDHVVQLVGPQHVGLALDYVFDQQEILDYIETLKQKLGPGEQLEYSGRLAPPETYPEIVRGLLQRGYPPDSISLILGGNWRRVAEQVWR